jgi:hypothetical protein
VEFCAREDNETQPYQAECYGCFDVDEQGQGLCQVNINTASWLDLAKIIDWSTSSTDHPRTLGSTCEAELCPLIDFVIEHRASQPFTGLRDFDDLLAAPELTGAEDLEGIEVRTRSGVNIPEGRVWGGLKQVAVVGEPDPTYSCCTNPDCEGSAFACTEQRLHDLPLSCEAL